MDDIERPMAERWFSRVVWAGIVANVSLAVPTLLAPEAILAFAKLPPATPPMWPRFAALLLILLSACYVPAGLDPRRYRAVAWLTVGARLAGAVFFLGFEGRDYRVMGFFDLLFFVPQAALLTVAAAGATAVGGAGEPA